MPMISKMNFDSFNMIYKFMYKIDNSNNHRVGYSRETMRIRIADASSPKKFQFSVAFDQSYVLNYSPLNSFPTHSIFHKAKFGLYSILSSGIFVNENAWSCRPYIGFPAGSLCLWAEPSSDSRSIQPYTWFDGSTSN